MLQTCVTLAPKVVRILRPCFFSSCVQARSDLKIIVNHMPGRERARTQFDLKIRPKDLHHYFEQVWCFQNITYMPTRSLTAWPTRSPIYFPDNPENPPTIMTLIIKSRKNLSSQSSLGQYHNPYQQIGKMNATFFRGTNGVGVDKVSH